MKNKIFVGNAAVWCLLSAFMVWHTKDAKSDVATVNNGAASDVLPINWQLSLAVGDATPITYSVSTELLP